MKSFQFFRGLALLIILNLLVKPVWIFFIDRQVQNIVGFEEYGKYFAVLNLSYVLFFLADAGLSNMMNQRMAGGASTHIAQLFHLKSYLLLIYITVCFFIGWLAGLERWDILVYVVLIQASTSLFFFLRSIVTAHQYFTTDAWLSVIDKFLMVLLCGGFIYTSFFGSMFLVLFLQIQLACTVISVIAGWSFVLVKKLMTVHKKESVTIIIKRIWPFAMIIFLMSLHYRLDGFLLERIHSNGSLEAGIYASAYRLLDAGNMVGYLAASFLVPFIAKHQHENKLISEVVINVRHVLLFFGIAAASFVIVFASPLQQLLYHSDDTYKTLVIQLCIASLPAYLLVHIYGSLLTATARFGTFIYILLLSAGMNLVLNLFLIPMYGALGCCIAALASQYFCAITLIIKTSKALSIPFANKANLMYLFFGAAMFLLFFIAKTNSINAWIVLLITVCITLLLLTTQLSFIKKYILSLR